MISSFRAQCAARVVREGGVIAYPTEAVWGSAATHGTRMRCIACWR